jgi:translation elongation factor P/translation initiation factor 5A
MASLGMNDVKTGQKILVNNDPCIITETEYVKPGKGQAFTRIKYRSIKSGRVVEMTMKATDNVEQADVVDTDMQFLYADGEYWHFMNQESFEQVQADKAGMGGAEKWLKGEEECVVTPVERHADRRAAAELRRAQDHRDRSGRPRRHLGWRRQAGYPGNRRGGPRAAVRRPGRNDQGRYPFR